MGPRDRGLWLGLVALPLLTGPLLAGAMETGFLVRLLMDCRDEPGGICTGEASLCQGPLPSYSQQGQVNDPPLGHP